MTDLHERAMAFVAVLEAIGGDATADCRVRCAAIAAAGRLMACLLRLRLKSAPGTPDKGRALGARVDAP